MVAVGILIGLILAMVFLGGGLILGSLFASLLTKEKKPYSYNPNYNRYNWERAVKNEYTTDAFRPRETDAEKE